MRHMTKIGTATAAVAMMFGVTACNGDDNSSQGSESKARQAGYDQMVKNQPADVMNYSPTRATINKWIETWDEPGKLAFVYLQNANGEYGYFITEGPPVSYCAMLTPTYEFQRPYSGSGQNGHLVPAPGMDGAYYSGEQCNAYYAIDATTGAYLEFTVGANQSFFLYDQPMQLPTFEGAEPLGPSEIDDVETPQD